jgi:hypothetical protein
MGLREKRRIAELNDEVVLDLIGQTKTLTGAEIPWEVDWESFASSMEALDNIEHQGLRRISGAINTICRDKIGKDAIREGLKKIVVKNAEDAGQKKIVFKDGILEVIGAWAASWEGYPDEGVIQATLENGL